MKIFKKKSMLSIISRRTTSIISIAAMITTLLLPASTGYADTTIPYGVTINVTDSSKQDIPSYVNSGGTYNKILSPAVRLAADGKAHISFNFGSQKVIQSKYSFEKADNINTLPAFPSDENMCDLILPEPNSYEEYKSDLGDNGYLTVTHYQYVGKQGQDGMTREKSFGTAVGETLRQMAVTGTDIYETDASSAFLLDTANGNTVYNTNKTTVFKYPLYDGNGKITHYMKNAGMKALKLWGYFKAPKSGSYLFGAYADDGAYGYITIDNKDVIFANDWRVAEPQFRATPTGFTSNTEINKTAHYKGVNLTEGCYYPIYMEWYEGNKTQGAFVPQYIYNQKADYDFVLGRDAPELFASNGKATAYSDKYTISSNNLYNSLSKTTSLSNSYFGDLSGLSFPSEDGRYYVAVKFVTEDGRVTKGLYGPFDIDNTKPVLNNLSVISSNSNNKLAKAGDNLTISFKASEKLKSDPMLKINNNIFDIIWTKDTNNNYTSTINTLTLRTMAEKYLYKIPEGPIDIILYNYSDLSGNVGDSVEDKSVTYDTVSPNVSLSYSQGTAIVGTEVITATYTEPLKDGQVPRISINQPGTIDISNVNMTMGANRGIWTYDYTVHKEVNDGTYKDGFATVSLSETSDSAGNISNPPTNNQFEIFTNKTIAVCSYSKNPICASNPSDQSTYEEITVTYTKQLQTGQIPLISINQQGSIDISNQKMTMGADSSIWTYLYRVNKADGLNYKDGDATVSLSQVIDTNGKYVVDISNDTFKIDTVPPTVKIIYQPTYTYSPGADFRAGDVIIKAEYNESVNDTQTPMISIDQPGSVDVSGAVMTPDSIDRKVWKYVYEVHSQDGSHYIDGTASVKLSGVKDQAGNLSAAPTNASFGIDTTAPRITSTITEVKEGYDILLTYTDPSLSPKNDTKITLGKGDLSITGEKKGVGGTAEPSGISDSNRTIYVRSLTGIGKLTLDILSGSAYDKAGNLADSYVIDLQAANYVESVEFNPPSYLRTGFVNAIKLNATVKPNNANQNVVFTLDKGDDLVSLEGNISEGYSLKGLSRGQVTVKATSEDPDKYGNKVTVQKDILVIDPKITIDSMVVQDKALVWDKVKLPKPVIKEVDISKVNTSQWEVENKDAGYIRIESGVAYFIPTKAINNRIRYVVKATALDGKSESNDSGYYPITVTRKINIG